MSSLTTDQCRRLIAYTCQELADYTWAQLNSLPYGVKRAFAAAQNTTAARGERLTRLGGSIDQINPVTSDDLAETLNSLDAAADNLLAALG